jgi:uncharacterized protein YukE
MFTAAGSLGAPRSGLTQQRYLEGTVDQLQSAADTYDVALRNATAALRQAASSFEKARKQPTAVQDKCRKAVARTGDAVFDTAGRVVAAIAAVYAPSLFSFQSPLLRLCLRGWRVVGRGRL